MTWGRLPTEAWAKVSATGTLIDNEYVDSVVVAPDGTRRVKLTNAGAASDFIFQVTEIGNTGLLTSTSVTFDEATNEVRIGLFGLRLLPLGLVRVDVAFDLCVYRRQ